MDLEPILYASAVIAAVTSAWLVPAYFRERDMARFRFGRIMEEVAESRERAARLEALTEQVRASIREEFDVLHKSFPAVPVVPTAAEIAAAVVEAVSQAQPERPLKHFEVPGAAEEARASREEIADRAAVTQIELLAAATEALGDGLGPAAIEWIKLNAPEAYRRAVRNPAIAQAVLGPVLALAKKALSNARPSGGAGYVM